jgi:hypothetical protein
MWGNPVWLVVNGISRHIFICFCAAILWLAGVGVHEGKQIKGIGVM